MQARLSIGDASDEAELRSLYRWLTDDPDVRRQAKVTAVDAPTQRGDMGPTLELVNVVLSNSIALSSLVVAVASWIGSRRTSNGTVVWIEYEGVRVAVDADSPEAIEAVIRALQGGAE
ncbi:hypothetical protein GCM10022254_48530 [Actinomadura meridiana]|uniref:Uncharacterized protein n=1 Tax=Actinomadura meridiana TaxID=559626 RepID=A0ABP8CBJ8_9ACTN